MNALNHMLTMAREAKVIRDTEGRPDPTADAYLAKLERGEYRPDAADRYEGPGAGRKITGVKRSGTDSVATEYTYEATPRGNGNSSHRPAEPMNDRQRGFIYVLLRQVPASVADQARPWFEANQATMTKRQASDVIDRLKGHRDRAAASTPTPAPEARTATTGPAIDRPAPSRSAWATWDELAAPLAAMGGQHGARFAVDSATGNNDLDFWVVDTWTGRTGRTMHGLKRYVGGQGPVMVRMSPEAKVAVAQAIHAAGPMEALKRFGRELGVCGDCGRSLTDEVSRSEGRGPICRNK